jgi:hypothetical protein
MIERNPPRSAAATTPLPQPREHLLPLLFQPRQGNDTLLRLKQNECVVSFNKLFDFRGHPAGEANDIGNFSALAAFFN